VEDYSRIFAEKLREKRINAKLTQSELGKMLNYSGKSVSKWEKGDSIPPINVLIAISECLHTELDEFFCIPTEKSFYLGIDGGGTKTSFKLVTEDDTVIKEAVLGATNPIDVGIEQTVAIIDEGIKKVAWGIANISIKLYAGFAGCRSGYFDEILNNYFNGLHLKAFDFGSDIDVAVNSAIGTDDGIAVIMGTGQAVIIQQNNSISHIGGLGYLFDRGGSGYDLGNDVIRSALMFEDGIGKKSITRQMILDRTGKKTVRTSLKDFYESGKTGIASYAPIVFEAYKLGDEVATEILMQNMRHIALLIDTASKRFDAENVKAVIVGGFTKSGDVIVPIINGMLKDKRVKLDYSVKDMALHAARMAREI